MAVIHFFHFITWYAQGLLNNEVQSALMNERAIKVHSTN